MYKVEFQRGGVLKAKTTKYGWWNGVKNREKANNNNEI